MKEQRGGREEGNVWLGRVLSGNAELGQHLNAVGACQARREEAEKRGGGGSRKCCCIGQMLHQQLQQQ